MSHLSEKAVKLLAEGDYTLAACSENDTLCSRERGVKPLLDMLDGGARLEEYAVADRVVGRAAAFLYYLLGARYVHAGVISTPAKDVFASFGIQCDFDTEVPAIRNRTDTGLCPMESAVWNICDPREAEKAIRETLKKLTAK